jgi:serine/threonine-protein kinase RsbW
MKMPSRRSAVAPTVERILEVVEPCELEPDQRDDLAVAVAEALSNAAVHGNRLRPGSHVHVTIEAKPCECAVIDIRDFGKGFDLSSVGDPTEPSRVLVPGGRGVFLMRRLVDQLEYNQAGNRVRLVIHSRDGQNGHGGHGGHHGNNGHGGGSHR